MDIYWKEGALAKATVTSTAGGRCQVNYGDKTVGFDTVADQTYTFDASLKRPGE